MLHRAVAIGVMLKRCLNMRVKVCCESKPSSSEMSMIERRVMRSATAARVRMRERI